MMSKKLNLAIIIKDREGKTKEEFTVSPDEAFTIRTLLHLMKRTSPEVTPDWISACKIRLDL